MKRISPRAPREGLPGGMAPSQASRPPEPPLTPSRPLCRGSLPPPWNDAGEGNACARPSGGCGQRKGAAAVKIPGTIVPKEWWTPRRLRCRGSPGPPRQEAAALPLGSVPGVGRGRPAAGERGDPDRRAASLPGMTEGKGTPAILRTARKRRDSRRSNPGFADRWALCRRHGLRQPNADGVRGVGHSTASGIGLSGTLSALRRGIRFFEENRFAAHPRRGRMRSV